MITLILTLIQLCKRPTFPIIFTNITSLQAKYKDTTMNQIPHSCVSQVIFRYALALFKYKEEIILKINDSVEMYQYLRIFPYTIADGR